LVDVLERRGVTAHVEHTDDTVSVAIDGTVRDVKVSGDSAAELVDSLLDLAAFILDEHGVLLTMHSREDLAGVAMPRPSWEKLRDDERNEYRVVEPHAQRTTYAPSRPRVMN
jgi:hypothetical protein